MSSKRKGGVKWPEWPVGEGKEGGGALGGGVRLGECKRSILKFLIHELVFTVIG